jgi:hypothetical protein
MAVTEPFTRSGIVPHKERSDRHEKELNARIAVAIQRTTPPRRRSVYNYDGEYEFLFAQHWAAPEANRAD